MKKVPTYCRVCEPQCALIAEVEDEQVIRLLPDQNHPVHKGFACHKGLNFVEVHRDPDRLNHPQRRTSSKEALPEFETVGWDDAISEVAGSVQALFDAHGEAALGFYIGNPSIFNSTGRHAVQRFARALGAEYMFGSGTQDCSNKFAAGEAIFGTANLHPVPDFKNTDYFLSIGCNPRVSHMSFVHMADPIGAMRDIVTRGGKVRYINPRKIESASPATGEVTLVKPDTDVYLLAALINEIKAQAWEDNEHIAAHGEHIEGLWDFVEQFPADRVAPVVGISAEEIREIAREFATAESASAHMSTGVNMGRHGTLGYWLLQMLCLVTGNLGRSGGNIYSPGFFPAATVGKPTGNDPFFDTPFGSMRRVAGSLPGNLLADHIEAGLIKGLVCMSGNPLLSMGGESRLARALASLELLIVVDIYPNATSESADYLLPTTDWLERPDVNVVSLGLQPEPFAQHTDAMVPAHAERKPEWWIFASLLQALGQPSPLDDPNYDPFARIDRQLRHSKLDRAVLRELESNTAALPDPDPALTFDVGVQRTDGKVDCCPELIQQGIQACNDTFDSLLKEPTDQLKLINLRTNYMVNSWLHNIPSLKRDHALDNPIHVNPDDCSRLGLAEGQEVAVQSDFGSIIATVKHDASLRPNVVAMTHGWGHGRNPRLRLASNHPGTNVNSILPTGPGSYDPLSNMSFMTGVPVSIVA